MSENKTKSFVVGAFISLFVCCVVFWIVFCITGHKTERLIVQHGCAHYDSQTGKWQWNKEVGK